MYRYETETRIILDEASQIVSDLLPEIVRLRFEISWKDDGSPVTKADFLIEDALHCHLTRRIDGIILIGEESFTASPKLDLSGPVAVLDPIDGTENFCSGLMEWGVGLSIWHTGRHLGSMLYMPELGCRIMTGDELIPIRSRIRGFSSSLNEAVLDGLRETQEGRIMGCSVYNMYNVIRGSFTRFTNPKGAYIWDLLPGLMLALEHGCTVFVDGSKFDGTFLAPDRRHRFDIQHRHDLRVGQGSFG